MIYFIAILRVFVQPTTYRFDQAPHDFLNRVAFHGLDHAPPCRRIRPLVRSGDDMGSPDLRQTL